MRCSPKPSRPMFAGACARSSNRLKAGNASPRTLKLVGALTKPNGRRPISRVNTITKLRASPPDDELPRHPRSQMRRDEQPGWDESLVVSLPGSLLYRLHRRFTTMKLLIVLAIAVALLTSAQPWKNLPHIPKERPLANRPARSSRANIGGIRSSRRAAR